MTTLQQLRADEVRTLFALARVSARHKQQAPSWQPQPHQIAPEGEWRYWVMLGGRGAGKTDAGAHYVNDHAEGPACLSGPVPHRMAIIAPSHDDAVQTCVIGETGLLRANWRIRFVPGAQKSAALVWPNGSAANLFGAFVPEDVERFRGPQHCLVWGDEFAAWRKLADVWDMVQFGLRLGPHPRMVLTSTPKPRRRLIDLLADPRTVVTRARTADNVHLPAARRAELYAEYGGTSKGRQELDAEIIEDVDGALWNRRIIGHALAPLRYVKGIPEPDYARIVVAIDPAVTSGEGSDLTGIVVAAMGSDGRGYAVADLTLRTSPAEWARRAVNAYREMGADRIVAEANNGGDLVRTVIAAVDDTVPVTLVHAARGKRTRAEPIAALYEQGRISHVAPMPDLEDEMCTYTGAPGEDSPDRMDALVWAFSDLFGVKVEGSAWGGGSGWGG